MITLPDRLAAVAAAIENNEAVDLPKVLALQEIDLARAGRQFVEDAIRLHEAEDERLAELLRAVASA